MLFSALIIFSSVALANDCDISRIRPSHDNTLTLLSSINAANTCQATHDLMMLHKTDQLEFIKAKGPLKLLRNLVALGKLEEAMEMLSIFPSKVISSEDREEYEYLLWRAYSHNIPRTAQVCVPNPATGVCDEGRLLHKMALRYTIKYPKSPWLEEVRNIAQLYYQYELKHETSKLKEAVNQYEAAVYPKSVISKALVNGLRGNNRRTDGKVYANCVGGALDKGGSTPKCDLMFKHDMIARILLYAYPMEEWVKPEDGAFVRQTIARYLGELKKLIEADPEIRNNIFPTFRDLDYDEEIKKRGPASVDEKKIPQFTFYVGQASGNESWYYEKLCSFIRSAAAVVTAKQIKGECKPLDKNQIQRLSVKKAPVFLDPQVDYNLYFWEDAALSNHIYVSRPKIKDEADFPHIEWKLEPELVKEVNYQALFKLLSNVFSYALNETEIKKTFLINGLKETESIKYQDGKFLDVPANKIVDFETAYQIFIKEKIRFKNYMAAGLQITAILGGGTAWYYQNRDFNMVDWDYNGEFDMRTRLTTFDHWKFDDNGPGINRKHINAGVGYYLASRMSGFTSLESFLISLASSTFWEYFVEFREVISINDQIVTPVSGFVLGEVFYQIGKKLMARHGGKLSRFLDRILGDNQNLMNWVRNIFPRRGDEASIYGFDPGYFVQLDAGMKAEEVKDKDGKVHHDIAYYLESEIVDIPLFEEPGMVRKLIMDTAFTRLMVHATASPDVIDDMRMIAKVGFMGYYQKDLKKDGSGELNGFNLLIAPASGVEIDVRKQNDGNGFGYKDMIVAVNVLGTSMNFVGYVRGVRFRMLVEVYGDFAMVKSYALDGFKKDNDISGAGALINSEEGYYYAGGVTHAIGLSTDIKGFEFGYRFSESNYSNITGRERDSAIIQTRFDITDRKRSQELFIKWRTKKNLTFKCAVEKIDRDGSIESFVPATGTEYRKSCSIMYSFL